MEQSFDPKSFDPRIFADSLAAEIEREFYESFQPVNLLTSITYEPRARLTEGVVITDGHMIEDHPLVWGFMDYAPFYMRLRVYLTHWLETIEAEIIEVRIASDQFEEVVSAKMGIVDWMHNGGPPLMN